MNLFDLEAVLTLNSDSYEKGLTRAERSANTAGNNIANTVNRLVKVVASYQIGKKLVGLGKSTIDAASMFESAFTGVRKTVDATEEEYKELSDWIMEASTKMALSKEGIAGTMEIAGQLGISGVENLKAFTETMVMLGDTTNLSAEEAAGALARFMNITGDASADVSRIGSVIVDLGNNFATTESDIVAMSTRLASAGTIAGLTSTDILALSTAMSSVGINAEAGGTAMTQTLIAISKAVNGDVDKLKEFAKASGVSAKEFAKAWKNKPVEALQLFIRGLNRTNEAGGNVFETLDKLGLDGIRQTNMLQSLALASDMLGSAVNRASEAFENNTALTHEAELRYSTMESRALQTAEAYKNLKVVIGKELTPAYGELMSFAQKSMDAMTQGFQQGGLEGFIGSLGTAVADGLSGLAENTPTIVSAGVKLVSAFAKGIVSNKSKFINAAKEIMKAFTDTLGKEFPKAKSVLNKIQKAFDTVFGFIDKHGYEIESNLKGILAAFLAYKAITPVLNVVKTAVTGVTTVIKVLNGTLKASSVINPYGAIATGLSALIGLAVTYNELQKKELRETLEENEKRKASATEYISKLSEVYEANSGIIETVEKEYQAEKDLLEELKKIVDANGKIKEGYEERAQVITDDLSQALGVEIVAQNGVIQNYDEILKKIDEVIEKKKIEALINANQDQYSEELKKQVDLFKEVSDLQRRRAKAQEDLNTQIKNVEDFNEKVKNATGVFDQFVLSFIKMGTQSEAKKRTEELTLKIESLDEALLEAETAYYKNQDFIKDFNYLLDVSAGKASDYESAITNMTNGIIENAPENILAKQYEERFNYLDELLKAYENGTSISIAQIEEATKAVQASRDAFEGEGKNAVDGYAKGLEDDKAIIDAARKMIQDGLDEAARTQDSHSPSKEYKKLGVDAFDGYRNGFVEATPSLFTVFQSLFAKIRNVFTSFAMEAPSWAQKLMSAYAKSIEDNAKLVQDAMSKALSFQQTAQNDVVTVAPSNAKNATSNAKSGNSYTINVNQPVSTPSDMFRAIRTESQYGLIIGEDLAW